MVRPGWRRGWRGEDGEERLWGKGGVKWGREEVVVVGRGGLV